MADDQFEQRIEILARGHPAFPPPSRHGRRRKALGKSSCSSLASSAAEEIEYFVDALRAGRASRAVDLINHEQSVSCPSFKALDNTNLVCGNAPLLRHRPAAARHRTIDNIRPQPRRRNRHVPAYRRYVDAQYCRASTEVHLARMVIPRSFSRSFAIH